MVGTRCVGVSRWSYLAPEAPGGKVLCGHKPQSKPHLSEPGTHQRTWRVMGRPARQAPQTPRMTRRNDRTRHDHAAAPLADCPFVPPFIPQKKSPQAQTPRNSPKTKQHHLLRSFRSFLSSLSSRSARAFSLNVFTLSSLRPCSIPWLIHCSIPLLIHICSISKLFIYATITFPPQTSLLPLRSFLSSLSSRSARAFSLNVFALSSLRPFSIP